MRYNNPFLRLFNASRYSASGLLYAVKNEQAFQYECIVFVIILVALIFISLPLEFKIILIFLWLIVMCLELINSAVEKAFDLIDENFRPEIKAGKDMLSAAVFLAVCFNIGVWTLVIFLI